MDAGGVGAEPPSPALDRPQNAKSSDAGLVRLPKEESPARPSSPSPSPSSSSTSVSLSSPPPPPSVRRASSRRSRSGPMRDTSGRNPMDLLPPCRPPPPPCGLRCVAGRCDPWRSPVGPTPWWLPRRFRPPMPLDLRIGVGAGVGACGRGGAGPRAARGGTTPAPSSGAGGSSFIVLSSLRERTFESHQRWSTLHDRRSCSLTYRFCHC